MGINITRFLETPIMRKYLFSLLALITVYLAVWACYTHRWSLLGIILAVLLLGWMVVKFAIWTYKQIPTWEKQIQDWWSNVVAPWWSANTGRVIMTIIVLATIVGVIALIVCLTVNLGPSLTSSGSICPACKGVPTATTAVPATKVTYLPDSSFRVVVREGEVTSIPLPRPYHLERWANEEEIRVTEGYVDATNKMVRVETVPGIDSSVVMFRRFSCEQYKCGPVVLSTR